MSVRVTRTLLTAVSLEAGFYRNGQADQLPWASKGWGGGFHVFVKKVKKNLMVFSHNRQVMHLTNLLFR